MSKEQSLNIESVTKIQRWWKLKLLQRRAKEMIEQFIKLSIKGKRCRPY